MKTEKIDVRLPVDMVRRLRLCLDKLVMSKPKVAVEEYGGGSLSTVVRMSIQRGLDSLEKEFSHGQATKEEADR